MACFASVCADDHKLCGVRGVCGVMFVVFVVFVVCGVSAPASVSMWWTSGFSAGAVNFIAVFTRIAATLMQIV